MSLSVTDRLQIRCVVVGISLVFTTSLSIYFLYGPEHFQKWPWFKFSTIMTLLTCLWTFTFWFFRISGSNKDSLHAITFALIVIPIDFILVYPGTENLGFF